MSAVDTIRLSGGTTPEQNETVALGKRIRRRREQKGLSIAQVAEYTGLTTSFLSQVETGKTGLSINSLRAISEILEVPIFHFLLDENDSIGTVVREGERRILQLPDSNLRYELLVPNLNYNLELFVAHLDPGSHSSDKPRTHPADECLLILSGTMELILGEERHILHTGDSITYDGRIPHKAINIGDEQLVFVSAVSPPVF